MSQNSSRSVVAGLLGGWLIVVGSPAGMAGGQPPKVSGVVLAQARPNPPAPNVEASIASLHQRLQITPAQEAPFGAVANAIRANARAEATAPHQPVAP